MESSDDEQATPSQSGIRYERCGEDLPSASTNTFAARADPVDDEVAKDLSTMARKVRIGQSSQKKAKFHRVRSHHGSMDTIIDSEEKLDQLVKRHPQHIAALPTDKEGLEKAETLRPSDDDLGPDEIWCMVDSGAGVHGAKTCHFSRYKVQPNVASKRSYTCVAACGTIMSRKSEMRVNAEIGGERHRVNFDDIQIDTPVISVRKILRHGSHVRMMKNDGYIKNKYTGKRLPFVVRQGVYFIKLKILDPDDEDENAKVSDFARP